DQIPPGLRKSGIPDSVLIPAPLKITVPAWPASTSSVANRSALVTQNGAARASAAIVLRTTVQHRAAAAPAMARRPAGWPTAALRAEPARSAGSDWENRPG